MDDVVVGAFIMAIAIVGFLALTFIFGMYCGSQQVREDCNAYGKAKIGDVMYECKKVTP